MRVLTNSLSAFRLTIIIASTLILCGCPKLGPKPNRSGKPGSGQGKDGADAKPGALRDEDVTGDETAAKAILAAMEATYANADSYADECHGNTKISFAFTNFALNMPTQATTSFVRPDVLRTVTTEVRPFGGGTTQTVFWHGGGQALVIVDGDVAPVQGADGKTEPEALRSEIITTSFTANPVITLLLPDEEYPSTPVFKALEGVRVYGEEAVDGAACHRLHGDWAIDVAGTLDEYADWDVSNDLKIGATVTLWVDKESHLLRKAEALAKFEDMGCIAVGNNDEIQIPTMRIGVTLSWSPRLNPAFAWHELLANVPGQIDDPTWGLRAQDEGFTPTKKNAEDAAKLARKVLKKTLKKYASAKTYQDTGTFHMAPVLANSTRSRMVKFQTAFKRPGAFSYRSEEEQPGKKGEGPKTRKRCAWRAGGLAKVWGAADPGVQEYEGLQLPIDAISCDSDSPIGWITGLLAPNEIHDAFLANAEEVTVLGYQDVGGVRCYKLSGKASSSRLFNVWIEKKKKFIRRIEIKYPGLGLPAYCSAEYEPTMNGDIPGEMLEFEAPSAPGA